MAGRRGVPARGAAGLGRPLLRHPGRKTRWPAADRDCARQIGAGKAGGAGPRSDRARSGRRPAAIRRAVSRSRRGRAAERSGGVSGSVEGAASRRNVAARGAGGAVPPQVARSESRKMKRAATLLVWLALVFGLPQALICGVLVFSSGWAAPLVLIFLLLPFVPLILMQEGGRWKRLPPAAPASGA